MCHFFILVLLGLYFVVNIGAISKQVFTKGNEQIAHSRRVAIFILKQNEGKPYNIATWPVEFTEDNYVYFLNLYNSPPLDRRKLEIGQEMYVLCNTEPCQVINSPSWNISMFGPARIDKMWKVDHIRIYKLQHRANETDN
jgi:hypothetical protein